MRARQVVNATGVWTDETQAMVGERGQFKVRASKGVHLVVPRDRIQSRSGLILRTETSVLFVIPWGRHWIIGTTDTDWELDKAHPAASASDIDYLLDHVNAVLATPLTREDVEGVYAGLRPLLSGEAELDLEAVARARRRAPRAGAGRGGRRQVHDLPGDGGRRDRRGRPRARLPRRALLHRPHPAGRRRGLPARRGTPARRTAQAGRPARRPDRAPAAAGTARAPPRCSRWWPPSPRLGRPLDGADDYLAAEVVYAASHEGARHLDDVLARRTRISIEAWDRGVSARPAGRRA